MEILDAGTDAHDLPGTVNRVDGEGEQAFMIDPRIEPREIPAYSLETFGGFFFFTT